MRNENKKHSSFLLLLPLLFFQDNPSLIALLTKWRVTQREGRTISGEVCLLCIEWLLFASLLLKGEGDKSLKRMISSLLVKETQTLSLSGLAFLESSVPHPLLLLLRPKKKSYTQEKENLSWNHQTSKSFSLTDLHSQCDSLYLLSLSLLFCLFPVVKRQEWIWEKTRQKPHTNTCTHIWNGMGVKMRKFLFYPLFICILSLFQTDIQTDQ